MCRGRVALSPCAVQPTRGRQQLTARHLPGAGLTDASLRNATGPMLPIFADVIVLYWWTLPKVPKLPPDNSSASARSAAENSLGRPDFVALIGQDSPERQDILARVIATIDKEKLEVYGSRSLIRTASSGRDRSRRGCFRKRRGMECRSRPRSSPWICQYHFPKRLCEGRWLWPRYHGWRRGHVGHAGPHHFPVRLGRQMRLGRE